LRVLPGHPKISAPASKKQMSWWQAITFFGGSGGGPLFFKNKSAFLNTGFTKSDIDKIYHHLTRRMAIEMKESLLQVDSYGGQVNSVCRTDTAAWHRVSKLQLQYQTYWSPEIDSLSAIELEDIHLGWIRDFYADMYSHLGGKPNPTRDSAGQWDGCYINYPDSDLAGDGGRGALDLYYGGNLPRLIRTKAEWDPTNFLRHRFSIPVQ
jgi:hexose oxidase